MSNTKTGKPKKIRPFAKLVLFCIFCFSIYLLVGVAQEIYTTFELRREVTDTKKKYDLVKEENDYLTSQKTKLEDPNYVQSYARSNYMLTKDGEKIFYLPADK